jgi:hypothetical protein
MVNLSRICPFFRFFIDDLHLVGYDGKQMTGHGCPDRRNPWAYVERIYSWLLV